MVDLVTHRVAAHRVRSLIILGLIAAASLFSSAARAEPPRIFNVKTYGAIADGQTDDQIAIAKTIKAASAWTRQNPANQAAILFPSGTYALTHLFTLYAINIVNARNLTLEGEPCHDTLGLQCVKLIGAPPGVNQRVHAPTYNSFFNIAGSSDITIRNFYLDKSRPYFAQGQILRVDTAQHSIDINATPGLPDQNDPFVGLIKLIEVFTDPAKANWDHTDSACAPSGAPACPNFHILARTQIGTTIWRITLDRAPPENWLQKPYFMWNNLGWKPGFMIENSSNVTLQNIFYTGGGGPGVHIQRCTGDITIKDFTIDRPPGSNRLFAATSGFNGGHSRARITLDHVHVAHTDDDAFHFSDGAYYPALAQNAPKTSVTIALCYDNDFRPGDHIAAWDWSTKHPIAEANVLSADIVPDPDPHRFPRACTLILDRPLPPLPNLRSYDPTKLGRETDTDARIVNLSEKSFLTVTDSSLSTMRARCGIIQMSASILHNTCENTILAGFLVVPEFSWGEGYAVDNVSIVGNHFTNVSGTAIYLADILDSTTSPTAQTLLATGSPTVNAQHDNTNILLQGNSFSHLGQYGRSIMGIRGVAISVENAHKIRILQNRIDHTPPFTRNAPSDIIVSPATTDQVTLH